ncbi:MAG: CPBP family intramembrane glutamic endopeptidase [Prochlorothrix sp.]
MTPKRILLWFLSLFALVLLGSSLLASFNQPQVQGRLELYQTNLLLAASEWQGDGDPDTVAQLRQQVLGDSPRATALKQYQEARNAVLKLEETSPEQVGSLGENWAEEVTLKQGILEAVQGNPTMALEHWQDLQAAGPTAPYSTTAQILTGLWSTPAQIWPNAEAQIQQDLTGWFQSQALQRLYQLQQRTQAFDRLQTQQEAAAEAALFKLLMVSVLPLGGGLLGVILLVGLSARAMQQKTAFPPAPAPTDTATEVAPDRSGPSTAAPLTEPLTESRTEPVINSPQAATHHATPSPWRVPWDGEITWQVMIVGFFFVGQVVVSQFLAPILLLILKLLPSLTDPANDLRAKAIYVLLVYIAMAIGVTGVLYWSVKPYWPLPAGWFRLQWRSNWLLWGLGGYLMALPLVTLTALLNQQIWQGQGGSNPILSLALENKDTLALACFFTTAAIAAPLFEEFVFRGFLLASLTRYFSDWGSIALSALIFSVAHLSLSEVLPLFVLGMVLGYIYRRTQNLLAPMLLHSLWNSATLVGLVILGSGG